MKKDKAVTKPGKSLPANQVTVVLIVLAVVVWVIGLIVSKSVFDIILFNNQVIGEKRQVESTLSHNLNTVEELQSNFENLQETVSDERVLRALPDREDIPGLASRIEALLDFSNVSFDSFFISSGEFVNFDGVTTDGEGGIGAQGVQEVVFSIEATGNFGDIKKMLESFEREISPMRLASVVVTGSERNATATLNIVLFYQPKVTLDVVTEEIRR